MKVILPDKRDRRMRPIIVTKNILKSLKDGLLDTLSPGQYTHIRFLYAHGQFPSLKNPQTFSERVCARKLNWRDERFVWRSDKIAVKDWVASELGQNWVIPTIYAGPDLPPRDKRTWNAPFVVKASHGSGMNLFIQENETFTSTDIETEVASWLKKDWARNLSEDWYNHVPRRILVEPIIGANGVPPADYKFFVFFGKIACIQVDTDRFSFHRRDFYSENWELLPFSVQYPRSGKLFARPKHFTEMCAAASKLGRDFEFVRVDLYDLDSGPVFGEMTFAPGSGFEPFSPRQYDSWLGRRWRPQQ